MRRVLAWLVVLGAVLFAQPLAQAISVEAAGHAHVYYAYDSPHHTSLLTFITTERGPPAAHDPHTAHNAVDRWSLGAAARPARLTPSPIINYDLPALLVQSAGVVTPTLEATPGSSGRLSSFQRSDVAANTGSRVFWSGGQPAKEAAEAFAKANGSKTLEMTVVGRTLEKLPYNRFTAELWDAASAGFAATARGNANVFIGPSFRGAGSTFGRIEGPILRFKGNPILQRFEDAW